MCGAQQGKMQTSGIVLGLCFVYDDLLASGEETQYQRLQNIPHNVVFINVKSFYNPVFTCIT